MKKMLILGPEEIQKLVRDHVWDSENILVPKEATIEARVRNPDSGAPETYLIVSWDTAE
jgi:hypothetical protein